MAVDPQVADERDITAGPSQGPALHPKRGTRGGRVRLETAEKLKIMLVIVTGFR